MEGGDGYILSNLIFFLRKKAVLILINKNNVYVANVNGIYLSCTFTSSRAFFGFFQYCRYINSVGLTYKFNEIKVCESSSTEASKMHIP